MRAYESTGVLNSSVWENGKACFTTKENVGDMVGESEKKAYKRNRPMESLRSVESSQEDSLKVMVTALLAEVVCMTEV